MLNTPSSRFATRTTRCWPSGRSSARPIACSVGPGTSEGDVEAEEAGGVQSHDLAPGLGRERQPEDVLGMVEVVVRPVGGEHRGVLAVEQVEQGDDVAAALGLLDRLGAVEEAAHGAARALLQERHLPPALDVL